MKTASVGSVSEGTMRTQDLVDRFLDVLSERAPDEHERIYSDILETFSTSLMFGDDWHPAWDSEKMSYILNEDIWDAMQEVAPEGCYFGAHPGDGASYGFWPVETD